MEVVENPLPEVNCPKCSKRLRGTPEEFVALRICPACKQNNDFAWLYRQSEILANGAPEQIKFRFRRRSKMWLFYDTVSFLALMAVTVQAIKIILLLLR